MKGLEDLKRVMKEEAIPCLPDYSKDILVHMHTSEFSIGGILM